MTASSPDPADSAAAAPTSAAAAPPADTSRSIPIRLSVSGAGSLRVRVVAVPGAPGEATVVASMNRRVRRAGTVVAILTASGAASAASTLELHTAFDPAGPAPVRRTAHEIGDRTP